MTSLITRGPLFLVGCPRSGTTLLQQMLDAHSQVAIAPETFFIRKFWKRRRHYADAWEVRGRTELIDDFIALPEFVEMKLDPASLRAEAATARDVIEVFAILLNQYARSEGAILVGEKTPNHLLSLRTLEGLFPHGRFLHIVRDPRGVVDSWSRVPWSNGSTAADAEVWRKYMAAARKTRLREPTHLLTLRYEELVTAPEATLRRICLFLDLEFESDMLRFHERTPKGVNAAREPWKANSIAPISTDSIDAWRDRMDRRAIRITDQVAWFEMRRLGYSPTSNSLFAQLGALRFATRRFLKTKARSIKRRHHGGEP